MAVPRLLKMTPDAQAWYTLYEVRVSKLFDTFVTCLGSGADCGKFLFERGPQSLHLHLEVRERFAKVTQLHLKDSQDVFKVDRR